MSGALLLADSLEIMIRPSADVVARLNDDRTVTHLVASAAATAELTLVDPRSLSPIPKQLYRFANAGLLAWTVWAGARRDDEMGGIEEMSTPARAALSLVAGAGMLGIARPSEAVDAKVNGFMSKIGVKRPRRWLAGFAAATAVAGWVAGRIEVSDEDEEEDITAPIPTSARLLAEKILAATEGFGAPQLREQLKLAQAIDDDWKGVGDWKPRCEFVVPPGLSLSVPAEATFPVVGKFKGPRGHELDVRVNVSEGCLESLVIDTADDELWWEVFGEGFDDLVIPSPAEVSLFMETPTGLQPIV